jgi:hypothetical protein
LRSSATIRDDFFPNMQKLGPREQQNQLHVLAW